MKLSTRTWLAIIVAVGLLLRLGLAVKMGLSSKPRPGSDESEYDSYAWNLAQGRGYRGISPDVKDAQGNLIDHPTAYRAPATAVLWAGLYRIFGHRYGAIRIIYCFLNAIVILLVYQLGCRCFNSIVGFIAAVAYCVWPTALLYTTQLASETPYTLLFTLYLVAALRFADHPSWFRCLWAGLLLGAAVLTRPNAVFMVALAVPWAWWQFRASPRARRLALTIPLVALATLIPWTVRNVLVLHGFIPFDTGGEDVVLGSYNRVVANDPRYYGYWVYPTSELPEYRQQITSSNDEVLRDRVEVQLAWQWLRDHPEKWWYLVETRFRRSLTPFLEARSPRFYRVGMLVSWGPVLVLSVLAYLPTLVNFLRNKHPGWILHLGVFHFVLTALIFWGSSRFRYPVEGLCIILASAMVIWLWDKLVQRPLPSTAQAEAPAS